MVFLSSFKHGIIMMKILFDLFQDDSDEDLLGDACDDDNDKYVKNVTT